MRSRKAAGAGCSPPPCRTGVSAAPCGSRSSSPLRTARPRYAQAAPLVTPCLRDHRHRLERDAPGPATAGVSRSSPASNGQWRAPAAKASRCCPRPPAPPGRRKADQHLPRYPPPRPPGCGSRAWLSRRAGPSRAPDTPLQARDINHSRYSAIPTASTERGQFSTFDRGYPLAYSQPVHRSPDVTRRIPWGPPSPHVIG